MNFLTRINADCADQSQSNRRSVSIRVDPRNPRRALALTDSSAACKQVGRTLVVAHRIAADNPVATVMDVAAMQKLMLNLNSIRAVREIRAGANPRKVGGDLGISSRNIDRIESVYSGIPDNLLAGIERLLSEREKLRRLISNLMHRSEFLP
jgi:hypothetical protein